jgi:hypothetical protein
MRDVLHRTQRSAVHIYMNMSMNATSHVEESVIVFVLKSVTDAH